MSLPQGNHNSFQLLGNLSSRSAHTEPDEYAQKLQGKASRRRRKKTRSSGEMGSVMLDKTGSFDSQQPAESIPEDIFLPSNCDGQRSVPNRGMHGLNRVKSAMNAAKDGPSPTLELASLPGSPSRSPFHGRPASSFDDTTHRSPSIASDGTGSTSLAFLASPQLHFPSPPTQPPLQAATTSAGQDILLTPSPARALPSGTGALPLSAPRAGMNGATGAPSPPVPTARFGPSASPTVPGLGSSSAATPYHSPGKGAPGTPVRRTTWSHSFNTPLAWGFAQRGSASDAVREPLCEEETSSFWGYIWDELHPTPSYPTTDVVWGQTERQRVYNAILYVPYQLERLIWYELLVCLDTFLAMFTLLPVRFLAAVVQLSVKVSLEQARQGLGLGHKSTGTSGPLQGPAPISGPQLFDMLCVAIFVLTAAFLQSVNAGSIYYWMKDLTREFLKLQVIHAVLEILDRILLSFIVDSLEALSGTCTLFMSEEERTWQGMSQVVADWVVSATLIVVHALVIMCQGMTFSVAMNSKRGSALVALLIASSFVEIKVGVFKRYDMRALFNLTCQDAIERFHMCLALLFVLVEEMDNSGAWAPASALLWRCAAILSAEVAIDVIKHAVISKFNDMRPGLYRELFKDVCEKARTGNSHTARRIVAFDPFAPAAFAVRIGITAWTALRETGLKGAPSITWKQFWAYGIAAWTTLLFIKVLLGYGLQVSAAHYLDHYDRTHAGKGRNPVRAAPSRQEGKKVD